MIARILVSLLAILIATSQARALPIDGPDRFGSGRSSLASAGISAATATSLFSVGAVPAAVPHCCEAALFLAPPMSFAAMLAAIPADGRSTARYNRATDTVTIDARPDAAGVAVLAIDTDLFQPNATVEIDTHGATSVLINVVIASCRHMPCTYNFGQEIRFNKILDFADRVVWNFSNAAAVTFEAAFGGAVVLPFPQSSIRPTEDAALSVKGFLSGGQYRRYSVAEIPPGTVVQARVANPEPACWCY